MFDKLDINQAITDGKWYLTVPYSKDDSEFFKLKFKINEFARIDRDTIDDSKNVSSLYEQGELWLLRLEIVDLIKQKQMQKGIIVGKSLSYVTTNLVIMDDEGYEFDAIYDKHLYQYSNFSEMYGLRNSDFIEYGKKMEISIMFNLPDEVNASYFLAYNGTGGIFEETECY